MTLNGESHGDPGDLPGMYSETVGRYRDNLIELSKVIEERDNGHELLTEYSRHAGAVSKILNAHCAFFEDSHPVDPAAIRNYMTSEMSALWRIHDTLVVDLSLYSAEGFRAVIDECTEQVREVIYNQLNSIQRNVKKKLADSVRAAWDDMSNEKVSSNRRVKSRAAAIRRLGEVAQGWFTLSEELGSAADLWSRRHPPSITGT